MRSILKGSFSSVEDIKRDFAITHFNGEVLYASYETELYQGSAYVILLYDGELYDIEASHCSCYGLELQWKPQRTNIGAIEQYCKAPRGHFPFPTTKELEQIKQCLAERDETSVGINIDKSHALKFVNLHLEAAKKFMDTITETIYDYDNAKRAIEDAIDKTKYLT